MMALSLAPAGWLRLGGAAALLALCAWTWRIDGLRGQHLAALARCRAQAAQQAEAFAHARQSAADLANAAKTRKEAEYAAARDASDDALADLRGRYRALLLRAAAADRHPAAGADLPRPADSARGPDGTRADPLLPQGEDGRTMVIDISDSLICADNTARLQAARQWAGTLPD